MLSSSDLIALQEKRDSDVQNSCAQRILDAEQKGLLIGQEAPVFRCHTFSPVVSGDTYARILTQQLNHLAESLGVLGFQVVYNENSFDGEAPAPDHGYFSIRVFAKGATDKPE